MTTSHVSCACRFRGSQAGPSRTFLPPLDVAAGIRGSSIAGTFRPLTVSNLQGNEEGVLHRCGRGGLFRGRDSAFVHDHGPSFRCPPDMVPITLAWAALLLIPGMALLISRIMYGAYIWPRRTLTFILLGASIVLIVPVTLLFLVIPIAVLAWAYEVSRFLFAVVLPVVLVAMLWTLVLLTRRLRKWGVRAEAERWLAEKRTGVSQRDRKWRNRGIRIAVCIPTLIALAVFLFLPETWGLATHLRWRQCGQLMGYRAPLPKSWVIFYCWGASDTGKSYVTGFIERGMARGGSPLREGAVSWWTVDTKSLTRDEMTDYDRWPPKPEGILDRRAIKIGSENLECIDYLPSYPPDYLIRSKAIAHVDCSGMGRLHANFNGSRRDLDAFYRVLRGITETK